MLLIACLNVATLSLGRAAARRKEIATRLALDADSGRVWEKIRSSRRQLPLVTCLGASVRVRARGLGVGFCRRLLLDFGPLVDWVVLVQSFTTCVRIAVTDQVRRTNVCKLKRAES